MKDTPKAPRHLRAATRRWWLDVCRRWVLEEHHVRLLTHAGEVWDRGVEARAQIKRDGLTVPTKSGGPRLHPCVRLEVECRTQFARLIRELDLDLEAPKETTRRPPSLRSVG